MRVIPWLVTVVALPVAVLGPVLLLRRGRLWREILAPSDLVLTALMATVAFIGVNIPGLILRNAAHAFLGPFAFLVTGLINEVLLYSIVTVLIVLVPKPGVVTLFGLTRFLMGAVILGSLTPAGLAAQLTLALMLDGALWLITRRGNRLKPRGRSLLLLMVTLGVVDVIASLIAFNVYMALYRLHYATWYIVLHLVVDGFIYTWVGVLLGARIAVSLQDVVGD